MYFAINGIYENGAFTLTETPPTTKKSKVVILFTDEPVSPNVLLKRVPGGLKHLGGSINDFDENLHL
jgi:hypothetical protein